MVENILKQMKQINTLKEYEDENANTLYKEVCVAFVEENGFKEHAYSLCNKICDMLIEDARKTEPLTSIELALTNIKTRFNKGK